DLDRLAVLGDREVLRSQPLQRLALFVADEDVEVDDVDLDLLAEAVIPDRRLGEEGKSAEREKAEDGEKARALAKKGHEGYLLFNRKKKKAQIGWSKKWARLSLVVQERASFRSALSRGLAPSPQEVESVDRPASAPEMTAALAASASDSSVDSAGLRTLDTPPCPMTAGSDSVTANSGCSTPIGATSPSSRSMASTILAVTMPMPC